MSRDTERVGRSSQRARADLDVEMLCSEDTVIAQGRMLDSNLVIIMSLLTEKANRSEQQEKARASCVGCTATDNE